MAFFAAPDPDNAGAGSLKCSQGNGMALFPFIFDSRVKNMLEKYLEAVRKKSPLIHNITNYVTANDVANMLLACGGSAVMADSPEDAEEITSLCAGLCANMGTLTRDKLSAMLLAGKKSNALSHPVVLDPVGVGSSRFRTESAKELLSNIKFAAIRGNVSEIKTLSGVGGATQGVDASLEDMHEGLRAAVGEARTLSDKTGAVVIVSGVTDIVYFKGRTGIVKNGCSLMSRITGSGCMLSALTAAFIAASPNEPFEAALCAVILMGAAGEIAFEKTKITGGGNSSFRNHLIDAVFNMDGETLERRADYEIH